jgi:hypothetical protein
MNKSAKSAISYATPTDNGKAEFSPYCTVNNQKRGRDCLLTQIKEFAMCSIILVGHVKGFIFLIVNTNKFTNIKPTLSHIIH